MSRNRPGYENNHSSRSLDHQQKHKKRKAAEKTNENHENNKRKRYPSSRQEGCAMSSRHKEKSLYVSNEEQSFTSSEHEEDSASVPKQTSLKPLDLKKVTKEKSLLSSRYKSRSLVSSKYDEPSRRSSRREEYSEESQGYKDNSHAPSRSKESSPESSRYEEYHRSSYSNKYSHASSSHKTNFHLSSNNKENSPTSSRQRKSPIPSVESRSKLKKSDDIAFRTGGAYIPPAKLKAMQERITDKGSAEYQRISWEALKKSITGLTNKVNISNISELVRELFKENIIRGKGILVRSLMQSQAASPTFTHVYAALAAVINTKFPSIIELLLKRLICQFKRGFRRNNKQACVSSARFIAHLVNQQAAHEILALEILSVLLENPTSDSIEVAIAMLKECGMKLVELTAKGVDAIFGRLHDVLHDGEIDKRVQYMIEVMYAIRKDKFKDFEAVVKELDLVEESDKFTHLLTLDEAVDPQEILNVFKFDPEYEENEKRFKDISKEILEGDSDGAESDDSDAEMDSEEENEEELGTENQEVIDMTETNLVVLRRKIYLTIQSSLDFEECAHKLLKFELQPGQVVEMCYMILDCCAQQRTYEKFYGLLAQRFCQLNKIYMEPFTDIFKNSYETIHRLETNKLRNVAKFFAHLLYTDAIPWSVLADVKLNEDETTSSSRIFIKILFQELCEYMGLTKLNERVKDVTLQEAFDGLFPRNKPHYTRFAINFFTSIGLGGLTDELREHLKSIPKNVVLHNITESKPPGDDSSDEDLVKSPSNNSSTTSTSSSSSDDSESDDSEQDDSHEKKRRNKHSKKRQSVNSRRKVDTEHSKQKLKSRRKHKKGS